MPFGTPRYDGDLVSTSLDGIAPRHAFETARLVSVREAERYVGPHDALLMSIARQASRSCQAPIGMVSVMEDEVERVLACVGVTISTVERTSAFCAHTILHAGPTTATDTLADPRFRDNPFVAGEPHVRFYAAAPILDRSGLPLGSVCVFDMQPREISSKCLLGIQTLAQKATAVLEIRRLLGETNGKGARVEAALQSLDALMLPLIDSKAEFA